MSVKKTDNKKKSPSYEFYGKAVYDPRRKNRIFIKCKRLSDIKRTVNAFIKVAINKKAGVIEIRGPNASTKEGYAELYSDAKVDREVLRKNTGIRGLFSSLFEKRGERDDEP
jgi:hypothetical protein